MKVVLIHHLFTHDMRWEDNSVIRCAICKAFEELEADCVEIKGWICLDPVQLSGIASGKSLRDLQEGIKSKLDYRGVPAAITFLNACESLINTADRLGTIQIHQGSITELSKDIHKNAGKDSIIISIAKQYTPFAVEREEILRRQWGDSLVAIDDHSLVSPEILMNKKGKEQYVVFSPFHKFAISQRNTSRWKPHKTIPSKYKRKLILKPQSPSSKTLLATIHKPLQPLKDFWKKQGNKDNGERLIMRTNRTLAKQIVRKLKQKWGENTYGLTRNDINKPTSMLARFLNSGVVSIREIQYQLGSKMPAFERELVFRSFYGCRMNATRNPHWKHQSQPSLSIQEYSSPKWSFSKSKWQAWITGNTGVPLIDASMRYLRQHGWLHNRLRMVVASYLTRNLNISWRFGEAWFAHHLFDYDATQNHFGWKGQASLSRDSSEYFRVMNPWLQGKKYDKDTEFIKQYVPELRPLKPNCIHKWETDYSKYKDKIDYPKPIILDHTESSKESIQLWKNTVKRLE